MRSSRPTPRLHITHLALGSLAKNESRLGYEKLRETYNTVRPASAPEAPPLDEWKGIGCICHHVFCRSLFSKLRKSTSVYRRDSRDSLNNVECEDEPTYPGEAEVPWTDELADEGSLSKDELIDKGLLSLLEDADKTALASTLEWGPA